MSNEDIRRMRETGGFRERIGEAEMGDLLAAFGNSEAKATAVLAMSDGVIYTPSPLHTKLMRMQGDNPGWRPNTTTPFTWCRGSLAPIGLVAEELVSPSGIEMGYAITDKGLACVPLVGSLLRFSIDLPDNIGLYHFLGSTWSTTKTTHEEQGYDYKVRSPMSRMQIFRQMTASPENLRPYHLFKKVSSQVSMGSFQAHLDSLGEATIIEYAKTDFQASRLYIHPVTTDKSPALSRRPRTVLELWKIITQDPDKLWNINELTSALSISYELSKSKSRIHDILQELHSQGLIMVENEFPSLNLTEDQKMRIDALIKIVDGFARRESTVLEQGQAFADQLLLDPAAVASLMSKAQRTLPRAKRWLDMSDH